MTPVLSALIVDVWDVPLTISPQTPDFWRPIEDGSNTQYRLAVIESLIPPRSDGPIVHFHEMHDEGFFVTVSKLVPGHGSHQSGVA